MARSLSIGALARRCGASAPTVRYYEQIGLLPEAGRRHGGHRIYTDSDVERLTFVRRLRGFGFSLDQIRTLLELREDPGRSCAEARQLAEAKLLDARGRMEELRTLEADLVGLITDCDRLCPGGPGPECVIIADLGAEGGRLGCCSPRPRGAG